MQLSPMFQACILQPALRAPQESPVHATDAVIQLMTEATESTSTKIDLFILPELCPIGYSEDTFANLLPTNPEKKEIFKNIDDRMQETARLLDCAICYGTVGWRSLAQQQEEYLIRQLIVDNSGTEIASYDKIHVCNYGDCPETRFFTSGTKTVSFSFRGWKFGLMICADLRYPVLSRRLVKDHDVDVLLQPACFERDNSFRTWKSFRETRAVENGCYFLASNYAGEMFGEASMTPPWVDQDHEPIVLDNQIGYLMAPLDRRMLEHARTEWPFYNYARENNAN